MADIVKPGSHSGFRDTAVHLPEKLALEDNNASSLFGLDLEIYEVKKIIKFCANFQQLPCWIKVCAFLFKLNFL